MTLTYNIKRGLLASSITILGIASLFSVYSASADATNGLLPLSDGTYTQWTPSVWGRHFSLVNEPVCNGSLNYNYTNTTWSRDSYAVSLTEVPDGSTITAIAITPCASKNNKSGSVLTTLGVFYRYNNINSAVGGNYILNGFTPTQLNPTTFNGLSLIKNSSSTLQIGAVVSMGTNGARLSRIAAVITYTPPAPLIAPSNLAATSASTSRSTLSWTDNSSNENGFAIERSASTQAGPFAQIATTSANTGSYGDAGLTSNWTYFYRVRAFNSNGYSDYSNTASTTIR